MKALRSSIYFVVLAAGATLPGYGSAVYSGTVSGVFTNPVLTGAYIDLNHNPVFLDNTGSAVYSGVGTSTVQWGTSPSPLPVPDFSRLIFTGNTVSNEPANTPFVLGTIAFLNGTSLTTSSIFGADLNLSFSGNGSVSAGVLKINIVATQNSGVDPYADADFIGFSSITPGPAIPTTFNVFEGKESTVTLIGSIVGDPQLTVSGLALPGDDPNGFLAEGQGSAAPEPGAGLMMLAGLAVLAHVGFRTRL
jgi:hypothetical protein